MTTSPSGVQWVYNLDDIVAVVVVVDNVVVVVVYNVVVDFVVDLLITES